MPNVDGTPCLLRAVKGPVSVLGVVLLFSCHTSTDSPNILPQAWEVSLTNAWGGIAVDDRRYYVGTSDHGELLAIDRAAHKIVWRSLTARGGYRTPEANVVLGLSTVVIGDGLLFAYDKTTGAFRWTYRPAVGNTPGLYGLASDGTTVYAGSLSGDLYAVDAETGAERWRAHVSPVSSASVGAFSPVLSGQLVLIGYKFFFSNPVRGGIAAFNAQTGQLQWRRELDPAYPQTGSGVTLRPVVFHDMVIVANEDGRLFALALTDGSIRWNTERSVELRALYDTRPLALSGDTLIAGSDTEILSAYDVRTGKAFWTRNLHQGSISTPLVVDRGVAYYCSLNGVVFGASTTDGHIVRAFGNNANGRDGPFLQYPAIIGDTIILPGQRALYGFPLP